MSCLKYDYLNTQSNCDLFDTCILTLSSAACVCTSLYVRCLKLFNIFKCI